MIAWHRAVATSLVLLTGGCGTTSPSSGSSGTNSARVVSFTERDEDNGVQPVPRGHIVDINSTLVIDLDRVKLLRKVGDSASLEFDQGQLDELDVAQRVSKQALDALPLLSRAMDRYMSSAKTRDDANALSAELRGVANAAIAVLTSDLPGFEAKFGERLATAAATGQVEIVDQYRFLFEEATDAVDRATTALAAQADAKGVFVQFGGWIVSRGARRPLHLPGFDEYPEGERFVVERIVLELDAAQQAQLKTYAEIAKQANEQGLLAAIDLERQGRALLARLGIDLEATIAGIKAKADEVTTAGAGLADGAAAQLVTLIDGTKRDIDVCLGFARQLIGKYSAASSNPGDALSLVAGLQSDLGELLARSRALEASLKDKVRQLGQLAVQLTAKANELGAEAAKIVQLVRAPIETMIAQFRILTGGQQINTDTLEFGEKVFKLAVGSVPTQTELNLINTGQRRSGDQLVFKLAAGKGDDPKTRRTLEEHTISMFQVLPHVEPAAALVLANPESRTNAVQGDFHYAPGMSFLLKSGSRKSMLYNRFFDPGIGINVAALDFDGDDNPELGVGGTLSMFRDWVQLGYGYNFGTDDAYWFLGLSIPLSGVASQSR